jgi:hypothetical protein
VRKKVLLIADQLENADVEAAQVGFKMCCPISGDFFVTTTSLRYSRMAYPSVRLASDNRAENAADDKHVGNATVNIISPT